MSEGPNMSEVPDYSGLLPRSPLWGRHRSHVVNDPNMVDLGFWLRLDNARSPLCVMVTVDLYAPTEPDAGHWLHLSVSRPTRLPTWADLVKVRDELGYADRSFVQLLPPARAWLNVHSYCLHLFSRLDADTVPTVLWDQESCDGAGYRRKGTSTGERVT